MSQHQCSGVVFYDGMGDLHLTYFMAAQQIKCTLLVEVLWQEVCVRSFDSILSIFKLELDLSSLTGQAPSSCLSATHDTLHPDLADALSTCSEEAYLCTSLDQHNETHLWACQALLWTLQGICLPLLYELIAQAVPEMLHKILSIPYLICKSHQQRNVPLPCTPCFHPEEGSKVMKYQNIQPPKGGLAKLWTALSTKAALIALQYGKTIANTVAIEK